MVKPLHALLVCLKELHVKMGEEDGKSHVNLHIRKAITTQSLWAKLPRATFRQLSAVADLGGDPLDADALSRTLGERDIPSLKAPCPSHRASPQV